MNKNQTTLEAIESLGEWMIFAVDAVVGTRASQELAGPGVCGRARNLALACRLKRRHEVVANRSVVPASGQSVLADRSSTNPRAQDSSPCILAAIQPATSRVEWRKQGWRV